MKRNILANYLGRGWSMVSVYLFVPLFAFYLGTESYGVVAFYAVLFGVFSIANVGLSATLSRELARRTAGEGESPCAVRDLTRTLEILFAGIACGVGAVSVVLAPVIANQWINAENLSLESVENAVRLMGLAMALRFPIDFYHGGIMGLQLQVKSNAIQAVFATLRGGLAVAVLALTSPTVEAYFWTQIASNGIEVYIVRAVLWNSLPTSVQMPRLSLAALQSIWKYAGGMFGISAISIVLSQVDKLTVSKLLSLEAFAVYSVATILARVPLTLANPIAEAVFPRLTQLVQLKAEVELRREYHRANQLVAVVVFPAGLTIIFFSEQLLLIWTRNENIATQGASAASVLAAGTICIGLLSVPYRLALANGWTSLNIVIGVISVFIVVPSTIILTQLAGLEGAAWGWLILNAAILLPYVGILHRKVLPSATRNWIVSDVGLPFIAAGSTLAAAFWLVPLESLSEPQRLFAIGGAVIAAMGVTVAVVPSTRCQVCRIFGRMRNLV